MSPPPRQPDEPFSEAALRELVQQRLEGLNEPRVERALDRHLAEDEALRHYAESLDAVHRLLSSEPAPDCPSELRAQVLANIAALRRRERIYRGLALASLSLTAAALVLAFPDTSAAIGRGLLALPGELATLLGLSELGGLLGELIHGGVRDALELPSMTMPLSLLVLVPLVIVANVLTLREPSEGSHVLHS